MQQLGWSKCSVQLMLMMLAARGTVQTEPSADAYACRRWAGYWLKRSVQLMLMMLAAGGLVEMQLSADAHDAGRTWTSSNTALN